MQVLRLLEALPLAVVADKVTQAVQLRAARIPGGEESRYL